MASSLSEKQRSKQRRQLLYREVDAEDEETPVWSGGEEAATESESGVLISGSWPSLVPRNPGSRSLLAE